MNETESPADLLRRASGLRRHIGEAFCTSRPSTSEEIARGEGPTFGGAGILAAVHEEGGAVLVETDYGMAWPVTPDTVIAFDSRATDEGVGAASAAADLLFEREVLRRERDEARAQKGRLRAAFNELRIRLTDEIARLWDLSARAADAGKEASSMSLAGASGGVWGARRLLNELDPDGAGLEFPGAPPAIKSDARTLTTMADVLAERGRSLIEESLEVRRLAFDALPVGTVLRHRLATQDQPVVVRLTELGEFERLSTEPLRTVSIGWVSDEWDRGNWDVEYPS